MFVLLLAVVFLTGFASAALSPKTGSLGTPLHEYDYRKEELIDGINYIPDAGTHSSLYSYLVFSDAGNQWSDYNITVTSTLGVNNEHGVVTPFGYKSTSNNGGLCTIWAARYMDIRETQTMAWWFFNPGSTDSTVDSARTLLEFISVDSATGTRYPAITVWYDHGASAFIVWLNPIGFYVFTAVLQPGWGLLVITWQYIAALTST